MESDVAGGSAWPESLTVANDWSVDACATYRVAPSTDSYATVKVFPIASSGIVTWPDTNDLKLTVAVVFCPAVTCTPDVRPNMATSPPTKPCSATV